MHFQTLCTVFAALAMSVGPALAMPEAVPELETRVAQCQKNTIHKVGAGCAPSQKGRTACSANFGSVIICTGSGPTWKIQNKCGNGKCNNNCVCV